MPLFSQLIPPAGPIRTLCLTHLARTAGSGILMAVVVLYFTRTVHIPPAQVGLALSIAAGAGLLAGIPAGRLADTFGPRGVTIVFLCLLGVFIGGYSLVSDFLGLLIVSALEMATESAIDAASGALIAGLIPPADRVRAMSYLRAAGNFSMVLGAAAAGIGLFLDTHAGYLALLFGAGGLYALAGVTYLWLPRVAPVKQDGDGPVWPVLRDAPYAVACLLNAVLFMNSGLLVVGLPIWISERTNAPTWVFPVVLILNATSVVLFQTWTSRNSAEVAGGARAMRAGGLFLAGGCVLFALTAGAPPWLAITLLLLAALVHVAGEMWHAAGSWSLAFGLAPDHAQGQYQGLFSMSHQLAQLLAPALTTLLFIGWGAAGWLVFAVLFVAAGTAAPATVRWAQRSRVRATEPRPAAASPVSEAAPVGPAR
jgi:MFS family permease